MSALDLARWQFGITTVYHFLFVPLAPEVYPPLRAVFGDGHTPHAQLRRMAG